MNSHTLLKLGIAINVDLRLSEIQMEVYYEKLSGKLLRKILNLDNKWFFFSFAHPFSPAWNTYTTPEGRAAVLQQRGWKSSGRTMGEKAARRSVVS